MIWVPNQLIAASVGSEAILMCNTEASPKSINYWTKDDEDALISNDKYEITTNERLYKAQMILKIRDVSAQDFGTFKCYARNSLGSTEGSIKLYGNDIFFFYNSDHLLDRTQKFLLQINYFSLCIESPLCSILTDNFLYLNSILFLLIYTVGFFFNSKDY